MEERERRQARPDEDTYGWGGPPDQHVHMPEHRLRRAGLRAEKVPTQGIGEEEFPGGGIRVEACPSCGRPFFPGALRREGPHRGKGPAKRTDEQIKGDVELALTADSWLDASALTVAVRDGVVTLAGQVADRAAKRRAEDIAYRVVGVRDVQNRLRPADVSPTTEPADQGGS